MEDIRPSANINKSQSLQMEKKDISEELAEIEEFRKRIELDQRETKKKLNALKKLQDEQDARIKYLQDLLASQAERDKVQEVFCSRFQEEFIALKILQIKSFDCVLEAENRFDGYKYAVRRIQVEKRYSTALREVRALAMFDHPGIVRVYAAWIESPPDGWQQRADMKLFESIYNGEITCDIMHSKSESSFIYIQMQCWNDSLASRLARNPLRDLSQTKSWFNQIVSAVEYIHEKGYIHGDLKPSNIVFTGNGLLKIFNLGIVAKQHDRCGTIIFMSPEPCSFFPKYSSKTDVFSLGLILTEMILVMTDDERVEVFDNYRHGRPNDQIEDRETAEFVAWLTQINPKSRPTCKEILRHSFLSDFRAE